MYLIISQNQPTKDWKSKIPFNALAKGELRSISAWHLALEKK